MNIKDFLIDNYIWILVIILITIVTVIGFIADKKKNGSKKEKEQVPMPNNQNMDNLQMNNQGPMQYQNGMMDTSINNNQLNPNNDYNTINQMNNNMMNMSHNMDNNFNTTLNNNVPNNMNSNFDMNINNNLQNNTNTQNDMNNQLNSNLNNNIGMNINNNQPNLQNNIDNSNVNNNQFNNNIQNVGTIPQPINQIPNNFEPMSNLQTIENNDKKIEEAPMYQPLSEQKPTFGPKPIPTFEQMGNNSASQTIQSQPNMMNQQENSIPNVIPTLVQPMTEQMPSYNMSSQNQMQQNNSVGMMPNFTTNNNTIPQPMNSIPTPQLVNSQPIMNSNTYNQPVMQNYQQPNPNMENHQSQNQMPMNFVFGPQNNNQNM